MARPITFTKPIIETFQNLKDGQIFKSYGELCNFLEQPIGGGSSKTAQMKMFERFFEFHKEGQKIIIDCVYYEPLSEQSNDYYSTLIQKIILDFLSSQIKNGNSEFLLLSKSQMSKLLGLIKSEYLFFRNKKSLLAESLDLNREVVDEFYNMTENRINGYIKTALNSLTRKAIINVKTNAVIIKLKSEDGRGKVRSANEEEQVAIQRSEYMALAEIRDSEGVGTHRQLTYFDIINMNKWKQFMDITNRNMIEYYGIDYVDYYYRGYELTLTENVNVAKDRVEQYILDNKEEIRNSLNELFVSRYKGSYNNLHKLSIDKLNKGEISCPYKLHASQIRAEQDYVDNGCKLIDATLNYQFDSSKIILSKEELKEEDIIPF